MITKLLVRHKTAVAFALGLAVGAGAVIGITDPGRIETIKMGDNNVVIIDHERETIRTCSLGFGMTCGNARSMITGDTIQPDLSKYGTPTKP